MKYLRKVIILHRVWMRLFCAALCLSLLCGVASAQQRRKQKTPRALALVQWPPKGNPVVVPIAILIDGNFYDASIYMADPVPMALEYGNVYEVEKSGEPTGFVTVEGARDAGGRWIGTSKYQTKAEILAASTRRAASPVRKDPEEGPPKLTRGDEKKPPVSSAPAPTTAKQEPDQNKTDDGRPRLQKPAEPESPQAAAPTAQAPATSQRQSEDPDFAGRPRLRRGKPADAIESAPAPEVARVSTDTTVGHKNAAAPETQVRILPAISDAGGPEPTSFLMPGSETAPPRLVSGMEDLARTALQKYADAHGGAQVGTLEEVEVRAFDLSLVSQATVVLTASAHPAEPKPAPARRGRREAAPVAPTIDPSLTYWITVVARENYNGELRPLQVWTTDDKHLDAYPRMELIDAVDADGDGRGELLFRKINDLGRSFVISRAGVDQLVTLYDSSQLSQ